MRNLGNKSEQLLLSGPVWGRVTKIAIDKRPRESENREHEESWTRALFAPDRLRREKDAGRGHPASHTEPAASTHRRADRTLCGNRSGKCQHRDLQLCAREDRNRFQNRPHHPGLQGDEGRKMKAENRTRDGLSFVARLSVCQTRIPVRSPALGSKIQQVPQRPHHVDMALVLSRLGLS